MNGTPAAAASASIPRKAIQTADKIQLLLLRSHRPRLKLGCPGSGSSALLVEKLFRQPTKYNFSSFGVIAQDRNYRLPGFGKLVLNALLVEPKRGNLQSFDFSTISKL